METAPQEHLENEFEPDAEGYVNIRVASRKIGMQNQYASYFLDGMGGRPNFGKGLRWKEPKFGSYHEIRIHKDDVEEFVRRVKEYKGIKEK